ncbi:MAG: hypothetical protein JW901_08720 [Dehalococcoidia bacterium]|nr:hypothetical protein [Dehalococcoidia bacterium]
MHLSWRVDPTKWYILAVNEWYILAVKGWYIIGRKLTDITNAAHQVYKYMGLGTIEKAWEAHQAQIKARTAEGVGVSPASGIGDYVEMSNREEVASGSSVTRIIMIVIAALLLPLLLVIQCLLIWLRTSR